MSLILLAVGVQRSSSYHMESLHRCSLRLLPISLAEKCFKPTALPPIFRFTRMLVPKPEFMNPNPHFTTRKSLSSSHTAKAGWLLGMGEKKKTNLPDIVKAGDPVLHEPAREVDPKEIGSERIQKIIDDMVKIIVLEDTAEYIGYAPKNETKAQDRRPFDLLVIVNPKLKKKSNRTAFFFEGCLSVDGFRAIVERHLDVEVEGLSRDGQPIKVDASGWQARILQHECDHLEGTLYVDKMVPRTFRTVENLDLPLAEGCPKPGSR
ncbi:hypothetical protein D5086_001542 [Populus alba]|uniref:Uncharacterized protein n=1 Tax=Populus alba TaxID=43335 RepID=A0ACC4CZ76_POPAL